MYLFKHSKFFHLEYDDTCIKTWHANLRIKFYFRQDYDRYICMILSLYDVIN